MSAQTAQMAAPHVTTRTSLVASGIYRLEQRVGNVEGSVLPNPDVQASFTNNVYVILGREPVLYLTSFRNGFDSLHAAVSSIVNPRDIRYIALTLWARDQMGALRLWLDACPNAVILCSEKMAETRTIPKSISRVKTMKDKDVLDLGSHALEWIDCANFFNGAPECGFLFERNNRVLFCGDLFSHQGIDIPPTGIVPTSTILNPDAQFDFDFSDPRVPAYFERLGNLGAKLTATMHGGASEAEAVIPKWSKMHLERRESKAMAKM